jgi:uncharacterized membrane protein (DUF2068 family)
VRSEAAVVHRHVLWSAFLAESTAGAEILIDFEVHVLVPHASVPSIDALAVQATP